MKNFLIIIIITVICFSCKNKDEDEKPETNTTSADPITPEGTFFLGSGEVIEVYNPFYTEMKDSTGNTLVLSATNTKGNYTLYLKLYTTSEKFEKGNYSFENYGKNKTADITFYYNGVTYISTKSGLISFSNTNELHFIGNFIPLKNTDEKEQFYTDLIFSLNISVPIKPDTLK